MCVHVFCGSQMPDDSLVWINRRAGHVVAYADSSLATADGRLTDEGIRQVDAALAALPGTMSLESAKPCHIAPL